MVVTVLIGTAPFNIFNRCGNFLYADQIRSRKVLHVTAAVDTDSLVLTKCNQLCPTAHVFAEISPPVMAAALGPLKGGASK